MNKSITVKQFAAAINVSEKVAYGMARCELFNKQKISFDISIKQPGKPGKRNRVWRIDLDQYFKSREAGLI
jgi:hypothetical protein